MPITVPAPAPAPAHDLAASIALVNDEIVVLGPGSTGFSMTRRAAVETCRRLTEALAEPTPRG